MVLLVSDEVRRKRWPRMVVTGFANGMVECRWYDGYGVKRWRFVKMNLFAEGREAEPLLTRYQRRHSSGAFNNGCLRTGAWMTFASLTVLRKRWIS